MVKYFYYGSKLWDVDPCAGAATRADSWMLPCARGQRLGDDGLT